MRRFSERPKYIANTGYIGWTHKGKPIDPLDVEQWLQKFEGYWTTKMENQDGDFLEEDSEGTIVLVRLRDILGKKR